MQIFIDCDDEGTWIFLVCEWRRFNLMAGCIDLLGGIRGRRLNPMHQRPDHTSHHKATLILKKKIKTTSLGRPPLYPHIFRSPQMYPPIRYLLKSRLKKEIDFQYAD